MKRSILLASIAVTLTACGGGGGGGGGNTATIPSTPSFVKFSALADDEIVVVGNGNSNEVDYTYDTVNDQVTALSNLSSNLSGTKAAVVYDSSDELSRAFLYVSGNVRLDWDGTASFTPLASDNDIDLAVTANGQDRMLIANPYDLGWDYQTFGTWHTGFDTGAGKIGSFSIGSVTAGGAIPTTGTATYNGRSAGFYSDSSGNDYLTHSDVTATADFVARTVALTTSNTQAFRAINATSTTAKPDLNFTGSMSYAAGTNSLSGTINTTGGMSGDVSGQFYGPNAEEIGGSFATSVTGVEAYLGAFGAKQ